MKLDKSEKILLSTGLFMCALIIGYNAFFVPEVEPTTIVKSEKVSNENVTSINSDDDIQNQNSINNEDNNKSVVDESIDTSKSNNFSDENHYYKNSLININTATETELFEGLKGVGKVIAKRIVEYREVNGGFSNIDELKNVKGIGEKVFDKIKDNITVK